MYLYHYPDIWYDYATWHAQNGSPDSAAVVFQRALKALPGNASSLYLVVLHSGKDPGCKKYCQFCRREFLQHLQCVFLGLLVHQGLGKALWGQASQPQGLVPSLLYPLTFLLICLRTRNMKVFLFSLFLLYVGYLSEELRENEPLLESTLQ